MSAMSPAPTSRSQSVSSCPVHEPQYTERKGDEGKVRTHTRLCLFHLFPLPITLNFLLPPLLLFPFYLFSLFLFSLYIFSSFTCVNSCSSTIFPILVFICCFRKSIPEFFIYTNYYCFFTRYPGIQSNYIWGGASVKRCSKVVNLAL